jgi:hypothetical protein
MSIIIFAIIVIIVCAMLVYAVDFIEALQPPFKGLIKALVILVGALAILNRAGVV